MEEPEPENSSTIIGAEKEEMEIGKDEENKIINVEEEQQENTKVEDEKEMAEEEDDDFGDFEEAPTKVEDAEENSEISERKGSSTIQLQITAPLSIPPIFHKAIHEIIEEPTIWQCSSASSSDGLTENFLNQTLPSPFDLFPRLDAGYASNEDSIQFPDEFMLKAHRLWTQICYLEEARALKFKWDAASLTYQRILWTLDLQGKSKARKHPMQREKQSKKKEEEGIGQASSKSTNAIGEQRGPSTSDGMNPSAEPPQIDSLMVPPADFDWRKSGLANPLTAQAVSSSAPAFDSDFFVENQSTNKANGIDAPMNPPVNSASILAGDLAALGLMSNSPEELEPAKTSMNPQLNGGLSMLDAGMLAKMGNLGGGIDGKQNKLMATLTQMEGGNGQQSG